MTKREELHKLVDALPEQHFEEVRDFLRELNAADKAGSLAPETLAAIEERLKDIEQGNTMSVEEYKRSRGL